MSEMAELLSARHEAYILALEARFGRKRKSMRLLG